MDIVTDLTAEAISYLTLFQDIRKGSAEPISLSLRNMSDWPNLKINEISVDELTFQQQSRVRDLVWHSPTRENGLLLSRQYFKTIQGLLNWLSMGIPANLFQPEPYDSSSDALGSAKIALFFPPFFWRQRIRSILYSKPNQRVLLAQILQYMPLQVILALAGKNKSAYDIRLYQYYDLPKHGELSTSGSYSYGDQLSLTDREKYILWWTGNEEKAVAFLINDSELLTELKKNEFPLPFETFFRDELYEIAKVRNAKREERDKTFSSEYLDNYQSDETLEKNGVDPLDQASKMRLMGLALSGGGIRSATFNLGVIQRLASLGVLEEMDYISTVSGGGYIGAWLSSWIKRAGSFSKVNDRLCPEKSADPLADEVRPIRWLRMYSNYLTPHVGIMSSDSWASGVTWLRNGLINQFVLILILLTALSFIWNGFDFWSLIKINMKQLSDRQFLWWSLGMMFPGAIVAAIGMRSFHKLVDKKANSGLLRILEKYKFSFSALTRFETYIPAVLLAWGVFCALLISTYFTAFRVKDIYLETRFELFLIVSVSAFFALIFLSAFGNYHKREDLMKTEQIDTFASFPQKKSYNIWPTVFGIVGSSFVAALVLVFLLGLFWTYIEELYKLIELDTIKPEAIALVLGVPIVLESLSISVVIRMALMGNLFPDYRREWWGRMGGYTHRFMLVWTLTSFSALIAPALWQETIWPLIRTHFWGIIMPVIGGWAGVIGVGVKFAFESREDSRPKKLNLKRILVNITPFIFMIGFLLIGSSFIHKIRGINEFELPAERLFFYLPITAALGVTAYLFSWRVGVNEFSLHHFYKNRLIRAYLGATRSREDRTKTANTFTGFDTDDDLLLSSMTKDNGYRGPFPIINAALNSTVVSALDRQDRMAESFIFSPLYSGYDFSPTRPSTYNIDHHYEYGYRPTAQFSNQNGGPTVGTAIAISGAAVNPNQGYNSSALTAFLLTMFNVRLGWWIGNPRLEKWKKSGPDYGLLYLLRDLIGKSDINMPYVCLSDGGHFDNMGVYELVRRRCMYIIVGDGEQDEDGICEGLANAIRRCRIDFGVDIDFGNSFKTKGEEKTLNHLMKADIVYPGSHEKGVLIYIKAILNGDEPVDIRQYADVNSKFPQQSTGDQFFDEAQFESYRKLGYHSIANRKDISFPD